MAAIEILEYPVYVKLGCFDVERLHGQQVLVSIKCWLRVEQLSWASDSLGSTIDYGQILAKIDEDLSGKTFNLVETIVQRLGDVLIRDFQLVKKVRVLVEKKILPGGVAKGGRIRVERTFDNSY